MHQYSEILTNRFEINIDNHEPQFTLKANSLLFFVTVYNENSIDEEWTLRLEHAEGQDITIDGSVAREALINYFEYYQEQFAYLDKSKSYFGQLSSYSKFILEENGHKNIYEKIDDYETSDGIKINAIKMLQSSGNDYWILDKEDTYQNKEFFYFEPTKKIDSNIHHFGYEKFKIPKAIEVSELFVTYPKMLDIVECFFKKQPLSEDLKKVYKAYKDDTYDAIERWANIEDIPITQVLDKVKENDIEQKRTRIMAEIERETAIFRQDLIKKRLNF